MYISIIYYFCIILFLVSLCKEKWKNLRTVFVRNMKPAPSGSSSKAKKPYYLNEYLQFLLPYVKPNTDITNPGNLPSPTSDNEITFENNEQSDTEVQDEDIIQQEEYLTDKIINIEKPNNEKGRLPLVQERNQGKGNKKKRKLDVSEVDKSFIDFVNMKKEKSCETDPRKMFLLSLLPDIKNMTDQQMRMFKKKVLDLVDDILTENPTPQHQLPITMFNPSRPPTTSSTFSSSSLYSYNHSNSFTPIHSPEESYVAAEVNNQNENVCQDFINM